MCDAEQKAIQSLSCLKYNLVCRFLHISMILVKELNKYTHTHSYTFLHTHTHSYILIHILTHSYTFLHTHTLSYTLIHILTHSYTFLHTHTHSYTLIHIITHSYTLTSLLFLLPNSSDDSLMSNSKALTNTYKTSMYYRYSFVSICK